MNHEPGESALGLREEALLLYRHVLRSLPGTPGEHAHAVGWSSEHTAGLLGDLERLGLVRRAADGTVRVDDPRATVGRLLDGEEAELDDRRRRLLELRETLETFEYDYRRGLQLSGPRTPPWERLAPSQMGTAVDHLLRTSTGPLLQVSRYISDGPGHEDTVRRQRERWLAAGGTGRSIFAQSVLESPRWSAFAEARAAEGEQQRYLPADAIPVGFGVFGRAGVLVPGGRPDEDVLLVRDPGLVQVFVVLFEELWRRAQPALGRDASKGEARLLELLALGFKDEAIARQLGLSLRTVRRRIAAVMEEHGVETRYQLGLAVGRLGLLDGGRR
jgi:DNA-binding CsgD family transcriptional regulator